MSVDLGDVAKSLNGENKPDSGRVEQPTPLGDGGNGDAPVKRGRGRPRKDEQPAPEYIDPATATGTDGGGEGSGTRARARTRPSAKAEPLSVEHYVFALLMAENLLATATQVPEFLIGEKSNVDLANAIRNVYKHYSTPISPKQQDLAMLAFTLGAISLGQVRAYAARKQRERNTATAPLV